MSTKSIVRKDNKLFWDVTSVTGYPVVLPQGNSKIPVYVYLSPYSTDELKDILRKATSGYRREKQDVEIVREDRAIYAPLCDAHFVKLGNATGTPDAQRAWLDKHPEYKPSIVEFTFGGLTPEAAKQEDDSDAVLDISVELSSSVRVFQHIYDEETASVVKVDMFHFYSHPSEAQYREYRGARRSKFIKRTTLWTVTEQHTVLEKLYDTVVESVDGVYVNGSPCTPSNKSEWVGHIPLWHKLLVVDTIFGELVEKND